MTTQSIVNCIPELSDADLAAIAAAIVEETTRRDRAEEEARDLADASAHCGRGLPRKQEPS